MDQSLFVDTPHPDANPDLFVDAPPPPSNNLGGMAESFGRGALNNFPLAQQAAAALTPGSYSQNLASLNQKASASKAANPISYGTGAVAGSVAPLAIPVVGEALEASPVLGNAALGAANAVNNTDILRNPGEAARQAIQGGVVGGTIGGVANKLLPGAGTAEKLEDYANRKGVQALNLRPGTLGGTDEELAQIGKKADEWGLIQGSTQDRVRQAEAKLAEVGSKIQEIGGGAQPLVDSSPFVNKLQNDAEQSAKIFGKDANVEIPVYRQGIANLQTQGQTFDQLQALKSQYGKRAFDADGNVKNQAAADVYGQIKDAMKSIIATSPKEYQTAMSDYGQLLDIHSGLMSQLQHEQAGGVNPKGFGLMGKLGGALTGGNVPATAGAAGLSAISGHPMWALGLGTTLTQNPQLMSSMARKAAGAIPAGKQAITQELNDYLTSKYGGTP